MFRLLLSNLFLFSSDFCSQFFWIWLTNLEIFFNSVSCKIRWLRLSFLLFWWRWLNKYSNCTTFFWRCRRALDRSFTFFNTFALGFFLLLFARSWRLFFFRRLRFIIWDMLIWRVLTVEIEFFGGIHWLPFFDNLWDKLRFPHSWELMFVLIVLLSGELPV